MLITTLTDVRGCLSRLFPRRRQSFVQLLGWLTWLACAWLLSRWSPKSHDLPWLQGAGRVVDPTGGAADAVQAPLI